jgi:hypothetical protein
VAIAIRADFSYLVCWALQFGEVMMAGEGNGARRGKRPATTESETASTGVAIRQAFLRHIDEQQSLSGFSPSAGREGAPQPKERPRGRTKR